MFDPLLNHGHGWTNLQEIRCEPQCPEQSMEYMVASICQRFWYSTQKFCCKCLISCCGDTCNISINTLSSTCLNKSDACLARSSQRTRSCCRALLQFLCCYLRCKCSASCGTHQELEYCKVCRNCLFMLKSSGFWIPQFCFSLKTRFVLSFLPGSGSLSKSGSGMQSGLQNRTPQWHILPPAGCQLSVDIVHVWGSVCLLDINIWYIVIMLNYDALFFCVTAHAT